jgi:hypothetical protein
MCGAVLCSGQFFDDFLRTIQLNPHPIPWHSATFFAAAPSLFSSLLPAALTSSSSSASSVSPLLSSMSNAHHSYDDALGRVLSAAKGLNSIGELQSACEPPLAPWSMANDEVLSGRKKKVGVEHDDAGRIVAVDYRDLNDLTSALSTYSFFFFRW